MEFTVAGPCSPGRGTPPDPRAERRRLVPPPARAAADRQGGPATGTDPPAGGTSLGNCRISAAAIDDDDLVNPAARHRRNDLADCPLLVEDWDDRGDARASPLAHRLQRTPHDAQAGGGSLLISARRNSW